LVPRTDDVVCTNHDGEHAYHSHPTILGRREAEGCENQCRREKERGSCGDGIDPEHEEALGCRTHGGAPLVIPNVRATLAARTHKPKRIRVQTSADTPTIVTPYPTPPRARCASNSHACTR